MIISCKSLVSPAALFVRRTLLVALLVLGTGATFAQATDIPLKTNLTATKRTLTKDAQGHVTESWVQFTKLLPGEEVTYSLACSNQGEAPASALVLSLPIPAEMTFAAAGIAPAGSDVAYSIDAGNTFAPLDRLIVTAPDGLSRPARPADVNVVRWTLSTPLAPGSTATVTCRAVLK